jgi:phage terminase small subunit
MTPAAHILNDRQARFAEEYLADLNATKTAIRAGYSAKTAASQGERLLRNVEVQRRIAELQEARSKRTEITVDAVLQRLWAVATADARELIEYRRTCCRYCHGASFDYQRTRAELARERTAWEAAQKKNSKEEFGEQGGGGYNATRAPHPDCPECFGQGVERAFVHDTRTLSSSAAMLYAGVKQTKDGIEIKMHDAMPALVNVGKHIGMFAESPPPPADAAEIARRVREALRAIIDADGLRVA